MACNGGLLSPTLVKNAMRAIAADLSPDGLGYGSEAAVSPAASSVMSEGSGAGDQDGDHADWLRPLSPAEQPDGYLPLATKRVREVTRRRSRAFVSHQVRPTSSARGWAVLTAHGYLTMALLVYRRLLVLVSERLV